MSEVSLKEAPKAHAVSTKGEAVERSTRSSRGRRRPLAGLRGIVVDAIVINLAFMLAWYTRYELELGREVAEADYLPLSIYAPIQVGLAVLLIFLFTTRGLYATRGGNGLTDAISTIVWGTLVGVALVIVAVFLTRPYGYSRLIFAFSIVTIITGLTAVRVVAHLHRTAQWRRGIGLTRVLVIGAGPLGRMIMQNIVAQPHLGMQLVGFVDDEREADLGRITHLGKADAIPDLVATHHVDEVIIALPAASHAKIHDILSTCTNRRLGVRIVPDFYELRLNQVDVTQINGIPLIGLRDVTLRPLDRFVKRAIDIVGAAFGLAVASPIILLIALAIKLDSPGPVLVRQVRVGRGGKHFQCYKFRSMRVGADREVSKLQQLNEADGPIFKIRNDPRRTRVGRYLRRLSLDELPQLYNVLLGDMSLVGPRPPLPHEVEKYEDWQKQRLEVPPGLTGLWQVSGRSDLSFAEMVLLDIWYIENWSLTLDLKILLRTIPAVALGVGAY